MVRVWGVFEVGGTLAAGKCEGFADQKVAPTLLDGSLESTTGAAPGIGSYA